MAELTIYERLMSVQKELKAPKGQYNSFGKYAYRSAEDIVEAAKPLCIANGLLLTLSDEMKEIGGRIYVQATATVADKDGNVIRTTALAREPQDKKGMDDSQITGAASSYARKYALNGLFAIDDTKDADTMPPPEKASTGLICSQCAAEIKGTAKATAQQIADWNYKNYGRVLCAKCGKAESEKLK